MGNYKTPQHKQLTKKLDFTSTFTSAVGIISPTVENQVMFLLEGIGFWLFSNSESDACIAENKSSAYLNEWFRHSCTFWFGALTFYCQFSPVRNVGIRVFLQFSQRPRLPVLGSKDCNAENMVHLQSGAVVQFLRYSSFECVWMSKPWGCQI